MQVATQLSHLARLEAESIHIIREVVAEFDRPVMLYSVGKDSSVMVRLAQKAFYPGPVPFPLLHVDTSYKFREMYEFRDRFVAEENLELLVYRNEAAIAAGTNPDDLGTSECCRLLKTRALLDGINHWGFDAAFGGARRDEEKSRAKERVFSVRDAQGQWDPKQQRPELWNLYNARRRAGEAIRVFPLSNWTETDVWEYIERESIPVVPMYFAREREVVDLGGQIIPVEDLPADRHPASLLSRDRERVLCRFRSLGCVPCTGAIRSSATTVREIIEEMAHVTTSERATRVIDHDADDSMERKKREGYF